MSDEGFPLDWHEWRREWGAWFSAHESQMRPVRNPFPGTNFLADEVLGAWRVGERIVELSEVVFPNLEERDANGRLIHKQVRRIGITADQGNLGLVRSFAELERELGLSDV